AAFRWRPTPGGNMVRYAEIVCSMCQGIFPGNVMKKVSDSVLTGSSITRNDHRPDTLTSHYSYKTSMLCPSCLRKRRMGQIITASIILVAAASLFLWISSKERTASYAAPSAPVRTTQKSGSDFSQPSEQNPIETRIVASEYAEDPPMSDLVPQSDGNLGAPES